MLGVDSDPGIMVRTLNDLFKKMELTSGDSSYKVTMSYLEVNLTPILFTSVGISLFTRIKLCSNSFPDCERLPTLADQQST